MKKCPVCHTESDDNAKFCQECSHPFNSAAAEDHTNIEGSADLSQEIVEEVSNEVQSDSSEPAYHDEPIATFENTEDQAAQAEIQEAPSEPVQDLGERWYYVESGKSKGPFSRSQFLDLIVDGTVTPRTYVWTKGMDEWTYLKNTALYGGENNQEAAPVEPETPVFEQNTVSESGSYTQTQSAPRNEEAEEQRWFYVVKNRTVGPFSTEVMIRNIHQGVIDGSTYVWREGYDDWKHLADTPFAQYLPEDNSSSYSTAGESFDDRGSYSHNNYGSSNVEGVVPTRNIMLYLLLSIVTCGIFELVWFYLIAADINKLCIARGRRPLTDPILVLVYSFLTCGIYSIYYFWKAGSTLYELNDGRQPSVGVIAAILGLILQPAALAILQDQINGMVEND